MHVNDVRPPRRTLSLTPLIDVVFLLLMFFMLASTFAKYSVVEVSLAGSGGGPVQEEARPVLLSVGSDGAFRLNGEPVAADDIRARLVELAAGQPTSVIVRPSAEARSQDIVAALERAKGAGVGNVALAR
ncbi:ExbD/TolR family protein [Lutibaculum baratangense]|uniref:Biopolymer transport protein ExbD/TolR n=1 Tax=Lutibaculum baratangense AMV1 TaxID=631454 RepID=V4RCN0_9HYPH|nr:biopolymer transporter ExbD [Lutibaculum baratangense]ESR23886.1 Biopolymer transport protein ExbD/TolR [Lutibaculum baratangense AMV1]